VRKETPEVGNENNTTDKRDQREDKTTDKKELLEESTTEKSELPEETIEMNKEVVREEEEEIIVIDCILVIDEYSNFNLILI
jgi:hypothetical protein